MKLLKRKIKNIGVVNLQAQRARGKLIREVEQSLRNVDAFIGNATDWEKVCVGNLVGLPLIVIPTGFKPISNFTSTYDVRRTAITTGIYAPPRKDHIVRPKLAKMLTNNL